MASQRVQDSLDKDSEFVDRAADIITKLAVQMDNCCPECRELIKEILKI
jgi:uncharacterized protein YlaN (UPF0358 family)